MVGEDLEGETLKNASIALIVSLVLYFVPGVNTVGPVIGGFIGGYLQKEGVTGGIKVGGLKGLLMILPAFPLALVVGALLKDIPILGALAAGGTIILAIILVSHTLIFGIGGGICAGLALHIIDAISSGDRGSAVKQSDNIRTDGQAEGSPTSSTSNPDGNIRGSGSSESSGNTDRRIR